MTVTPGAEDRPEDAVPPEGAPPRPVPPPDAEWQRPSANPQPGSAEPQPDFAESQPGSAWPEPGSGEPQLGSAWPEPGSAESQPGSAQWQATAYGERQESSGEWQPVDEGPTVEDRPLVDDGPTVVDSGPDVGPRPTIGPGPDVGGGPVSGGWSPADLSSPSSPPSAPPAVSSGAPPAGPWGAPPAEPSSAPPGGPWGAAPAEPSSAPPAGTGGEVAPGWPPTPAGTGVLSGPPVMPPPGVGMVPAPPPGPGVRAPFVAPPTERDRKRMWIGLGVGGALLVLCCIGGLFAFGALVIAGQSAVPNEARTAVTAYLDGLRDHDYRQSYDRLCTRIQQDESYEEFVSRESAQSDVSSYSLDEPQIVGSSVTVGATISRADGTVATVRFTLISDQQAGELRICGAGP